MLRIALISILAFASLGAPALALQNPCTLLTRDEVQTALGVAVAAGEPQTVQGGKSCRWIEPKSEIENVYIQLSGDGKFMIDTVKPSSKPVSGVGVPAIFFGGNVYMLKGNTAVLVGITHGEQNNTTVDRMLPALAKLVYSRVH